jgi:hypothetical protein
MSCGSEDKSGEMLRSLLTLWPPTRVTDDTGDTDDVKVGAVVLVGDTRCISERGEFSSFRRLGAGAPSVDIDDVGVKPPNLCAVPLAG